MNFEKFSITTFPFLQNTFERLRKQNDFRSEVNVGPNETCMMGLFCNSDKVHFYLAENIWIPTALFTTSRSTFPVKIKVCVCVCVCVCVLEGWGVKLN